jgi:hypothetical protein
MSRWHQLMHPVETLDYIIVGPNHFLFASLQEHSIIREDGSLHYFAAG